MSDLERFRSESRAWLEANAPAELRGRPGSELEGVWGGRQWEWENPDPEALARALRGAWLHRADLAARVRRRRPLDGGGEGARGGDARASSCRRR